MMAGRYHGCEALHSKRHVYKYAAVSGRMCLAQAVQQPIGKNDSFINQGLLDMRKQYTGVAAIEI